MRYIFSHDNGTLWFQIRVPSALIPRFGQLVRQNLGTSDLSEARSLALRLAGDWLSRFSAANHGIDLPQPAPIPALVDTASHSDVDQANGESVALAARGSPPLPLAKTLKTVPKPERSRADTFAGLLTTWKRVDPYRTSSTIIEVQRVLQAFDRFVRKRPSQLERSDIAAWRDRLIGSGQARATVSKKI